MNWRAFFDPVATVVGSLMLLVGLVMFIGVMHFAADSSQILREAQAMQP